MSMMGTTFQQQTIQKAHILWDENEAFKAGGVIFETIPVNRRHQWAYEILKLASDHFPFNPRIEAVLAFAQAPENWRESIRQAHEIVDEVNQHDDFPIIFRLATQIGKIVYTAQQFPAPFDHSAGWKIAEMLKLTVQEINDREFEAKAWLTLANQDFIVLEEPVMCHPGCPTCIVNGLTPMGKLVKD